jgi:hypothetical protein
MNAPNVQTNVLPRKHFALKLNAMLASCFYKTFAGKRFPLFEVKKLALQAEILSDFLFFRF